jgi:ribosomal protein RSM22 (predicted rRNA methylase)
MLAAAAPDGVAIAIEPALRETARALHRVRAALLEGGAEVLAPCTHRAACPMLADERDWCHEERPLGLPERTGRLAHETGLRDDGGLCFAYLVLAHRPTAPVATAPGEAALRVVSHPSHPKGKVELDACGADGLVPLRLLRRHRADGNRGFERARRGDVLVLGEGALAPAIPGKPRDLAPGASVALHAIARDDR